MARYFDALGISGAEFSRRAGVSHSQVYMARERHVGAKNAAKIAQTVRTLLSLSCEEELELKAEIMGEPGNLVRAYLGNGAEAADVLGEEPHIGWSLVNGSPLSHKAGTRVIGKLRELGAPEKVVAGVRSTVRPKPSPPGRVTYTATGEKVRDQRDRARKTLETAKPATHRAIIASGLSRKEIYERAEVARETLRQALYGSCGAKAASSIATVLVAHAGLSDESLAAVEEELVRAPEEISGNSRKKLPETR